MELSFRILLTGKEQRKLAFPILLADKARQEPRFRSCSPVRSSRSRASDLACQSKAPVGFPGSDPLSKS